MVYQGSKNKLAKYIIPIIQNYIDLYGIETYIEPFVGGANMIDKVVCKNRYGFDSNEYVIALLNYAKHDKELSIAPKECSFEHYKDVRDCYNNNDNKYSKEYIALIGYMASYGGRFFDGGYGRDSKGGRSIYTERLKNLKKQSENLQDISFQNIRYEDLDISKFENCLFYLDPPYKDTKKYSTSIDYNHFYEFCSKLSEKNIVLISEYSMPEQFKCIWQKERNVLQISNRTNGQKAIEKLFIINGKE